MSSDSPVEQKKRILRERARILAKEPPAEAAEGDTIEIVEFLLAYEKYGIESRYVREVYPLTEITPVPCTPPFIAGIINVRGQIISVTDLKKLFELPEKGLTDLNKVIILRNDTMELGMLADAILGVRRVPGKEIQLPPPTLTGIRARFVRGLAPGPIVFLDAANILTSKNLTVHEE